MTKKKIISTREAVRRDLFDQLDRNGTVGEHYKDLVDDYMTLWDVKEKLADDIKNRGAKVLIITATSSNLKTNDSVIDTLKVNAQMLKILDTIGIKPAQLGGDSGDDEM